MVRVPHMYYHPSQPAMAVPQYHPSQQYPPVQYGQPVQAIALDAEPYYPAGPATGGSPPAPGPHTGGGGGVYAQPSGAYPQPTPSAPTK
jgi:hypothetical protein